MNIAFRLFTDGCLLVFGWPASIIPAQPKNSLPSWDKLALILKNIHVHNNCFIETPSKRVLVFLRSVFGRYPGNFGLVYMTWNTELTLPFNEYVE